MLLRQQQEQQQHRMPHHCRTSVGDGASASFDEGFGAGAESEVYGSFRGEQGVVRDPAGALQGFHGGMRVLPGTQPGLHWQSQAGQDESAVRGLLGLPRPGFYDSRGGLGSHSYVQGQQGCGSTTGLAGRVRSHSLSGQQQQRPDGTVFQGFGSDVRRSASSGALASSPLLRTPIKIGQGSNHLLQAAASSGSSPKFAAAAAAAAAPAGDVTGDGSPMPQLYPTETAGHNGGDYSPSARGAAAAAAAALGRVRSVTDSPRGLLAG